jgi:hypothetical protein
MSHRGEEVNLAVNEEPRTEALDGPEGVGRVDEVKGRI